MPQVILNVLLFPVLAGLQLPVVLAEPLVNVWPPTKTTAAKNADAIILITHYLGFEGCLEGAAGSPELNTLPLPVLAGLWLPDVVAGPVTDEGTEDC